MVGMGESVHEKSNHVTSSIELRFWNVAVANRSPGKCVLPRLGMAHALSSGKIGTRGDEAIASRQGLVSTE